MNARRKNGYKGFKRQAPGTKKHESMTRTTFNALASKVSGMILRKDYRAHRATGL